MKTLRDVNRGYDEWEARVQATTAAYATPRWKLDSKAQINRRRSKLARLTYEYGADYQLPTLHEALVSPLFSETEKWAIRWQFSGKLGLGSFTTALIAAAAAAGSENQARLRLAYPDLIDGIQAWRNISGWSDFVDLIDRG